jgi:hypothetical protein
LNNAHNHDDDREQQKHMNEPADGVSADQAQSPQDQKHYENRPEHDTFRELMEASRLCGTRNRRITNGGFHGNRVFRVIRKYRNLLKGITLV